MWYFTAVSVLVYLVLNAFFDVNHAVNTCIVLLIQKTLRKSKVHLTDIVKHRDVCLTTDLDLFCHMNNSRYMRMGDIGRVKLLFSTGVWQIVNDLGGFLTAAGYTVRFRKSLTLFTSYTLLTKIIYWDDSAFYIEQQFVRNSDRFVMCVAIVKQAIVNVRMDQVLGKLGYVVEKPQLLPELGKWIECVKLSSDRQKKTS